MSAPTSPRKPGYESLRKHRWSAAGAEYYVTFNSERRSEGLTYTTVLQHLDEQRQKLEIDGVWTVRSWVVMPDHIHVLFTLGTKSNLSECMRAFKGPLTPLLRRQGLHWQEGFFEHRMRSDEDRLPVFLYIYMNPYRENLLLITEKWPGYFCCAEDGEWFSPVTNSDVPFPEWLQ